jgi:hypothetical protein
VSFCGREHLAGLCHGTQRCAQHASAASGGRAAMARAAAAADRSYPTTASSGRGDTATVGGGKRSAFRSGEQQHRQRRRGVYAAPCPGSRAAKRAGVAPWPARSHSVRPGLTRRQPAPAKRTPAAGTPVLSGLFAGVRSFGCCSPHEPSSGDERVAQSTRQHPQLAGSPWSTGVRGAIATGQTPGGTSWRAPEQPASAATPSADAYGRGRSGRRGGRRAQAEQHLQLVWALLTCLRAIDTPHLTAQMLRVTLRFNVPTHPLSAMY